MDKEKVIEALHCRAYDDDFPCFMCAYYRPDEKPVAKCDYRGLMDDAIALLKEQEAVKPLPQISGGWIRTINLWYCGACHAKISKRTSKFCSNCGRPVKWE